MNGSRDLKRFPVKVKPREYHGGCGTKLYGSWRAMRDRCRYEKHTSYKNYGARGISVYKEWDESFTAFRTWALKNSYKEGLQINRIDNDGNYNPSNCNFQTRVEQCANKRSNKFFEHKGRMWRIVELAEEYKISGKLLSARLIKGWTLEDALSRKVINNKNKSRKLSL